MRSAPRPFLGRAWVPLRSLRSPSSSSWAYIAQLLAAGAALLNVFALSRSASSATYASYIVIAALWALGNAVIGTKMSTRIIGEISGAESREPRLIFLPELLQVLAVVGTCAAYSYVVTSNSVAATLAGAVVASFAFSEVAIAACAGANRMRRYCALVAARTFVPAAVFVLTPLGGWAQLDLIFIFTTILLVNIAVAAAWPYSWIVTRRAGSDLGAGVGLINLALWIMASGDKLVLERLTTVETVAIYGVAYGIADRAVRTPINAYIAGNLRRHFSGAGKPINVKSSLFIFVVILAGIPAIHVATRLVSGDRYGAPWSVVSGIVVGVAFMALASPLYIRRLASGITSALCVVAWTLAATNVALNVVAAPTLGAEGAALISAATYLGWFLVLLLFPRTSPRPQETS